MPSIKLTGWLLVIAIIIITGLWLTGIISFEIYEVALGVVGVGGLTGLRAMINSSGYKTYILILGGVAGIVLFVFHVIDQNTYSVLMISILGLQSGSVGSAINKTPNDKPALKSVA